MNSNNLVKEMTDQITTYEPDNCLKKGRIYLFKEIFRDIKGNRWLTYQLFKRDFLAIYRQSFIGILWAVIVPLVSVFTFILLSASGIVNTGDVIVPYAIYAIFGMSYWQLFATGLIAGSNSLVKAGGMISKINFSKKSLVIASMGQSLISFLIQFVLLIILFFIFGFIPNIAILFSILALIPLLLLTLGLAFLMALLNGILRDIGNFLAILITFLMFLTPILYAKPTSGFLLTLTNLNPVYYLISVPRELALFGTITEWPGFLIFCILSVVIFIGCKMVFHKNEYRITERI